jgi:L-galactose dehydrogenase
VTSNSMERRLLGNTGLSLSVVGYGAAPLGGAYGTIDEAEGIRSVREALDGGINYFDTSPYYGHSETVLGRALNGVPRDQFVVSTKVGRYGPTEFDFSKTRVQQSVDNSLRLLGVDCLDIILCHDVEFGDTNQVIGEAIPTLRSCVAAGKARAIGFSGLPLWIFPYIIDKVGENIDVILSYCHYSLVDTSLDTLLPYLKSKNVGVINASPLSMGLLAPKPPPAWHPASENLKSVCANVTTTFPDIAELGLAFSFSRPDLASTLVGMPTCAEVKQNIATVSKTPDPRRLQAVRTLLNPVRDETWPSGNPEPK